MIKISRLRLRVGERKLISNEDYCFPDGSMTFLKGVSGSGKTTFLYVLGLISKQKEYAYYFNGKKIENEKQKETIRKNEIGMMYQNFNMLEHLSLYDNLKLFANINSCAMSKQIALDLLHKFSLDLDLNRKFGTLSGGEKQRFSLACILAKNPSVIICDEPTSALDQENANQLMDLLYQLCKEDGKTVIVSTHSAEYDTMADNMIMLSDKSISQNQPQAESKLMLNENRRKLHHRFYLDMIKQRLLRIVKHSWLVMAFMILALSLSTFLLSYSKVSEEEYTYYLNQSMQNEVFLMTNDPSASLSQKQIDYILNIPGIENMYSIKMVNGDMTLPSGERISPVQIFSVAPFQQSFSSDECVGDSLLYKFIDEDVILEMGDYKKSYKVSSIYTGDRIKLFSTSQFQKVFISEEEFNHFDHTVLNQYVLEIQSFSQFEDIASKIDLVTDEYTPTSAYRHFLLLLENLKQQETFIMFTSIALVGISLVLFVMVQVHEVKDKKREMCIFQANGLNKKHIFKLELMEYAVKFIVFYSISCLLSLIFIVFANNIILDSMTMTMDTRYLLLLFVLLLVYIIIPGIISVVYFLRQSPEDELRAIS